MKLSEVLREWRWAKKINIRTAAKDFGISAATLSRIERGNDVEGNVLAKILRWLLEAK